MTERRCSQRKHNLGNSVSLPSINYLHVEVLAGNQKSTPSLLYLN